MIRLTGPRDVHCHATFDPRVTLNNRCDNRQLEQCIRRLGGDHDLHGYKYLVTIRYSVLTCTLVCVRVRVCACTYEYVSLCMRV